MSLQPPPINTYGVFTLLPPFTIDTIDYRCAAIQLISALIETGVDVFTLYYLPFNINEVTYKNDIANNVSIITLLSDNGPTINVPSSFISNAPIEISVPYGRTILSIDLGPLPDAVTLDGLINYLNEVTIFSTGVTPIIKLHKVPIKQRYSPAASAVLEATRLARVNNLVSFYTGKVSADAELLVAKQRIIALEQIISNLP